MGSDRLSGRQLGVAAFLGGLSRAGAAVGDWRWMAVCSLPMLLLVRLCLKKGRQGVLRGRRGAVCAGVWCACSAVLLSSLLDTVSDRMARINGDPADRVWILLLLSVPLLRMAWGRSAPFYRAAELLWLAAPVLLAGLALFALPHADPGWAAGGTGEVLPSAAETVLVLSPVLFTVPYIYKVEGTPSSGWLWGAAGTAAVLSVLTVGLLGPALAVYLPHALFVAAGAPGSGVRAEGLISVLWLLPDLILAGLLSRSWGGRFGPLCAVGLSVLLVLTGISGFFSTEFLALAAVLPALLTLVLPVGKGRVVVSFW